MKVILLRHATAQLRCEELDDFDRELTRHGMEKLKLAAQGLKNLEPETDLIFSSPYIRAQQTAKQVAKAYGILRPHGTLSCLEPDADPSQTIDELEKISNRYEHIIMCGHQPHLGNLACLLINATPGSVEMKKAGAVKIDLATRTLVWALPPKVLRALSDGV